MHLCQWQKALSDVCGQRGAYLLQLQDCVPIQRNIYQVCSTNVKVSYDSQTAQLPLINVKGDRPTLLELGRNWLQRINLNWSKIHYTPEVQGIIYGRVRYTAWISNKNLCGH